MFNLGFSEIVVVAVIALIFIGPKQLPEVARVVGRMLNEFRRATGDLTRSIYETRESARQFVNETQQEFQAHLERATAVSDEKPKTEPTTIAEPEAAETGGKTEPSS